MAGDEMMVGFSEDLSGPKLGRYIALRWSKNEGSENQWVVFASADTREELLKEVGLYTFPLSIVRFVTRGLELRLSEAR